MNTNNPTFKERAQGCLLGLAFGDAVGTTLEFKPKGSFEPIHDMLGGGPFKLQKGYWTDDTSMALCLAHSLVGKRGFNAEDQMNRYCNWWQLGYMSSTGECFDIGNTVLDALHRYLQTKNPFSGSIDPRSAGNGSLMRLAPVILFYYADWDNVIRYAGESSRTTHGAEECIDSCRLFADLVYLALSGVDKESLASKVRYKPTSEKVKEIATFGFVEKNESQIKGSGYVVQSMEAALWSFFTTSSFRAAILKAANLGDDADTTAAICGQIAGAYYGVNGIPEEWLCHLYQKQEITELANQLINAESLNEQ